MSNLQDIKAVLGTANQIQYFVGRGTWRLLSDADSGLVTVELGFMGLYGDHLFKEDRYIIY